MNTRSRERKKRQEAESLSSSTNGDVFSPPDSPSQSDFSNADGRTRRSNAKRKEKEIGATPPKRQAAIYRVPLNTWNFFVRKYEVPRKTLHVSIGFVCLYLYKLGYEPRHITPTLVYIFIPAFFGDVIRFIWPAFNRLWTRVMGPLMRDKEKQQWNGVIFYLLGAWIVLSFFPKDIAIVSILLLSWSDTAASTFGRLYGKYGPQLREGKSLIGSLAAMATGALAAYIYWGILYPRYEPHVPAAHFYWSKHSIFDFSFTREGSVSWTKSTSKLSLTELCSLTGLVAGLAEAIDLWGLDDNLVIPVLSALFLRGSIWLLSKVK